MDCGDLERRENLSLDEFYSEYGAIKPVSLFFLPTIKPVSLFLLQKCLQHQYTISC